MATLDELVLANGAKPGGQQGRSKRRGSIDVAARMKADIAAVAATQAAAAEGAGVEGAEVSLEERFEMLQRASSHSVYFRGFEDEELRTLAANMAIFHFDAGETIMQKGESASWVGVVLDGELEARDESGVRLGAANVGALAGEISLFQGGVRGAMMVSTQPGAVAAITFDELRTLYESYPEIGMRLVRLFGQSSLMKLGDQRRVLATGSDAISWNLSAADPPVDRSVHVLTSLMKDEGFCDADVRYVCHGMRWHGFVKGDLLMKRGEVADYVCVVLQGRCNAHVSPTQQLPISTGELVGDIGFFKQQVRTIDVVGATDGILGGISADLLREAGRSRPRLAFQLVKWLAEAAIAKVAPELVATSAALRKKKRDTSVGAAAQVEVLYRRKMVKERQEKALLEEDHQVAIEEKTQAKHQAMTSRIVERKMRLQNQELIAQNQQLELTNEERRLAEKHQAAVIRGLHEREEELLSVLGKKDQELAMRKRQVLPYP